MSAHFCAAIPNFRIMEFDVDEVPWKPKLLTRPYVIENGELLLPDRRRLGHRRQRGGDPRASGEDVSDIVISGDVPGLASRSKWNSPVRES